MIGLSLDPELPPLLLGIPGLVILLLRLSIGQIFVVHGYRKITKKEGSGTSPYLFLGYVEAIAGILMISGYLHQIAAIVFVIVMIGAISTKLFIWPDQKYVSNIEYDVLILAASLFLLFMGPGMLALLPM